MSPLLIGVIIGAVFGLLIAIDGVAKRRDRRDANRYLAEKARAERRAARRR